MSDKIMSAPHDRDNALKSARLDKLEELQKIGVNPYPYKFEKNIDSKQLNENYKDLAP